MTKLNETDLQPAIADDDRDKRVPRANKMRKLLLDVALDCFSSHGFGGTSTRMIADIAGVSHSLVLYHFRSKDQLWFATMAEVVGTYTRQVEEIAQDRSRPAAEILRTYIEKVVLTFRERPQLHRIFTQQSTQNSKRLDWLVEKYVGRHYEVITDLILRAQKEGAVREGDPSRLYYFIIGSSGFPFSVNREYELLTGRDVFSAAEIHHLSQFISDVIFSDPPTARKNVRKASVRPSALHSAM